MSRLSVGLGHLKNDVTYPSNRAGVLAACNNMSDVEPEDRDWITKALPEGNYRGANEVVTALLAKV